MSSPMNRLNFKTDILPFTVATIGEFIALSAWIAYSDQRRFVLANVLLWIGFLIERVAVVLWLRYVYRRQEGFAVPKLTALQIVGALFAITITEVVLWFVWLGLVDWQGFVVGTAALMVMMLFEHSWELSLVRRTPPWSYIRRPRTIFFTVMEVVAATLWLYFLRQGQPLTGAIALFVGLSIEHVIQGTELKPEPVQ